ncbi:MAG: hypothetical protein LIQ30_05410 [Planctomycetes bacterium]|nr:hypothetical protein [Planctomycetota bacterium]MCD7896965.1 hypothetical protein [Planctomycetaceae bacterium]
MSLSNGVMGLFGLGLGVAGTVTDSYAAYQQAKAEKLAAEWNAKVMRDNADLSDALAGIELEKGKHEVAIAKRDGALLIESQRAGFAASGVKVDTGSALDVVVEQAGRNRYDQDMIDYNARMSAWGYNVEAANLRQQAAMTEATGRNPGIAAGTSLLGGATSLFNQYRKYPVAS